MNSELVFSAPGVADFQAGILQPLESDSLRIKTHLSGIRHGEDLRILHGQKKGITFPHEPCAWVVGEVVETGTGVTRFASGDIVHGPMHHCQIQTVSQNRMYPIRTLRKEFCVFTEPGVQALRCIQSSGLCYGDSIVIFGMGTVGLMALQYAMHSGARNITAVDPLISRLNVAQRLGAHNCIHIKPPFSTAGNSSLETLIPADIGIELSGTDIALKQAAECICSNGKVVAGGNHYREKQIQSVKLICREKNADFITSQPRYDQKREEETVIFSMEQKRVIVWPIITDEIPFEQAPKAYQLIRDNPGKHIKVILRYKA